MLKFPHDRHKGYVALTDGEGNLFVPEFPRAGQTSELAYCQAFMALGRRLDEQKRKLALDSNGKKT